MIPDPEDLPGFAKKLGVQGSLKELCKNMVMCDSVSLHPIAVGQESDWSFLFFQEMKKAILSDMTKLGKEAGLKSFEQVMFKKSTKLTCILEWFYWHLNGIVLSKDIVLWSILLWVQ